MKRKKVIIIFGPTGIGKSILAIKAAKKYNGIIINADSMQVYDILKIVTARPDVYDMNNVPHYLYGFVHPSIFFSMASWLNSVNDLFKKFNLYNKNYIFVGGTGLYIIRLIHGSLDLPKIDSSIKKKWENYLKKYGINYLYQCLLEKDYLSANKICNNDKYRIIRALEVIEGTGYSIVEWRKKNTISLLDDKLVKKIALIPDKNDLKKNINLRIDQMLDKGVIKEIKKINDMKLNKELPAMKAIGVKEFIDFIEGKENLDNTKKKIAKSTLRYAKRQITWIKNQMKDDWKFFNTNEEVINYIC